LPMKKGSGRLKSITRVDLTQRSYFNLDAIFGIADNKKSQLYANV